jgi:hypothetical protein
MLLGNICHDLEGTPGSVASTSMEVNLRQVLTYRCRSHLIISGGGAVAVAVAVAVLVMSVLSVPETGTAICRPPTPYSLWCALQESQAQLFAVIGYLGYIAHPQLRSSSLQLGSAIFEARAHLVAGPRLLVRLVEGCGIIVMYVCIDITDIVILNE